MKRGIIFSVVTMFLVLTVLTLASFYSAQAMRPDINEERVRNVFANVRSDFQDMMNLSACAGDDDGTVVFSDSFPVENGSYTLAGYNGFVESTYKRVFNSNVELILGEPKFTLEPSSIVYGYPSYDKQAVWVYDAAGEGLGAEEVGLTVQAERDLVNVSENTTTGDMKLLLNATFNNAVYAREYMLSRSGNSTITLDLGSSAILITAGGNLIGGVERNGSVWVGREGDAKIRLETRIKLNESRYVGVRTNLLLKVNDAIERSDYVWLTTPAYASD